MEPIRTSRIITLTIVLCLAWFMQFFGWSSFRRALREGVPSPVIIDVIQSVGADGKEFEDVQFENVAEGEVPMMAHSRKEAEAIVNRYYIRKWLGLGCAILGAVVLWGSCYLLADDKILGIVAIFIGPLVVVHYFS